MNWQGVIIKLPLHQAKIVVVTFITCFLLHEQNAENELQR